MPVIPQISARVPPLAVISQRVPLTNISGQVPKGHIISARIPNGGCELKRACPPRHVKKLRLLFYSMRAHRLDAGVPWSDINSKIFLCEIAKYLSLISAWAVVSGARAPILPDWPRGVLGVGQNFKWREARASGIAKRTDSADAPLNGALDRPSGRAVRRRPRAGPIKNRASLDSHRTQQFEW